MTESEESIKKHAEAQKAYQERKTQVGEFEKRNNAFVVFFESNNDKWWKIGWNSLLFYQYEIAPKLKKRVNVRADRDFRPKSPTGIVSFRSDGMKTMMEKMEGELGMEKIKNKNGTKGVVVYALPKPITKENLKIMQEQEKVRKQQMNNVRPTVVTMPEMDKRMYDATMNIRRTTRKWKEPDRMEIGYDMVKLCERVMESYRLMTWGDYGPEEGLKEMRRGVVRAMARLEAALRLEYFDLGKALQTQLLLREALVMIDAKLGKVETATAKEVAVEMGKLPAEKEEKEATEEAEEETEKGGEGEK